MLTKLKTSKTSCGRCIYYQGVFEFEKEIAIMEWWLLGFEKEYANRPIDKEFVIESYFQNFKTLLKQQKAREEGISR